MIIVTIIIVVYVLSVISLRWSYRLCSSRYYGIWEDKYCKAEIRWFIPIFNTLAALLHWIFIFFNKPGVKDKKNRIISKWLNTDL